MWKWIFIVLKTPLLKQFLQYSFFAASSKFQLTVTEPDLAAHRVEDPFRALGPIAIFSARRHWTAPRVVRLQRHKEPVYIYIFYYLIKIYICFYNTCICCM